ncbi:hypothetical protein B0T17DRAFT_527121 [Bombardia bombarda]|uniref:Pentatricopeptide repeat-containing protein n=1 Tax=Bombardia bombarda TaxID=252184 RepID=A0AA40CA88_9PEZI|nr:hypothetical protein B0T17DRAFT_527121 [Bombardia bombarda]
MLERTAAGIEPCGLHRALPQARHSFKSRPARQLHTAFWNHGAASFELFDACQALARLPFLTSDSLSAPSVPTTETTKPKRNPGSMTASTFLLDFLYPHGAAALLRRLYTYPFVPTRLGSGHRGVRKLAGRLYTSSAPVYESRASTSQQDPFSSLEVAVQEQDRQDRQDPSSVGDMGVWESGQLSGHTSTPHGNQESSEFRLSDVEHLRNLMRKRGGAAVYDMVWKSYIALDPGVKDEVKANVMKHLAQSVRPIELQRFLDLFRTLDIDQWTENIVKAAIQAHLVLHDATAAMDLFKTALSREGWGQALDAMIAYGFNTSSWEMVIETWELYSAHALDPEAVFIFEQLPTVTDIGEKIKHMDRLLERSVGNEREKSQQVKFTSLLSLIARNSLALFQLSDAFVLVHHSRDPLAYESLFRICMERDEKSLAVDVYRKYRQLPGVKIRISVLRVVLDLFYPHDAVGMEQVLRDWHGRYPWLDPYVYEKYIAFYAGRGDLVSTRRLAGEYIKRFRGHALRDQSLVTTLMHVHAVRGDPTTARRVLKEAEAGVLEKPQTIHWNVMLNAYVKAGNYEMAIRAFSKSFKNGQVDDYSFGTMMGMTGSRGDLHFTLELFSLAQHNGIKINVPIIDTIVEAFCQNELFADAEALCVQTTTDRTVEGEYTVLWNTLLHHYAMRRDLGSVNRLLDVMSEQLVPHNDDTYSHLLTALMYCRQSHHALQFLKVAEKENIFKPKADHYLLLMASFLHDGAPHLTLHVNKMMRKMGFPQSNMSLTHVIDALGRYARQPGKVKLPGQLMENGEHVFLSKVINIFLATLVKDVEHVETPQAIAHMYSKLMFIFTKLRRFSSVDTMLELYKAQFPDKSTAHASPIKLLHSLMIADLHERNYDSVKSTWKLVYERTVHHALPVTAAADMEDTTIAATSNDNNNNEDAITTTSNDSNNNEDATDLSSPSSQPPSWRNKVSRAKRYSLCEPLKTMQQLYLAENDGDGLLALVAEVRAAGFELDARNWNFYVSNLARLRKYWEAFSVCETKLMPQWRGWYHVRARMNMKNAIPLDLRRLGGAARARPRPLAHTMLYLAKAYIDLEELALWSPASAKLFREINEGCEATVQAIKTMERTGDALENEILGGQKDQWREEQPVEEGERRGERRIELLAKPEGLVGDNGGVGEDPFAVRRTARELRAHKYRWQ